MSGLLREAYEAERERSSRLIDLLLDIEELLEEVDHRNADLIKSRIDESIRWLAYVPE